MEITTKDVKVEQLQLHPAVAENYQVKNVLGLKLTMKEVGLLEPLKVVAREDSYFIIDGGSRFLAALELEWKTIPVSVLDLTDEEIMKDHVFRNYRVKRPITELIHHAKVVLDVLGLSQGKKRNKIGDEIYDDESLVGKDRFQIACGIIDVDMSSSTLRKLIEVHDFVDNANEEVKKMEIIEKLDAGDMKIHQAYNAIKTYQDFKKQQGTNELTETLQIIRKGDYQLFNKTCENLSDLIDNSINTTFFSLEYFNQRDYSRGDYNPNQIGLLKSEDDYLDKNVCIINGLRSKMKESSSLFINISDTYHNGVNLLIVEKLTLKLVESGWRYIQKWIWQKDNQKPQNNIRRLLPSYEHILHFVKDEKKYYWREFINWKEGSFNLEKSSNQRELGRKRDNHSWTISKPFERFRTFLSAQHVENVIHANGFNWSDLKKIDPNYKHPAPMPDYIPVLPILMTTKVGHTVLDIFNGTGTTTAVGLLLGRKVIGYDIDSVNHKFAQND
jgi:DNA modification methylase